MPPRNFSQPGQSRMQEHEQEKELRKSNSKSKEQEQRRGQETLAGV
jgi:hypothetical protein